MMLKFLLTGSRRFVLVMALLVACPSHGQPDSMQESESVLALRTALHNLHAAVRHGDARAVEHELAGGVDLNQSAALELAILMGHGDIVDLLIARGADVNRPGLSGNLPIGLAVRRGQTELVRRLIDQGADINLRDRRGQIAMDHARKAGRAEMIQLLQGGRFAGAPRGSGFGERCLDSEGLRGPLIIVWNKS